MKYITTICCFLICIYKLPIVLSKSPFIITWEDTDIQNNIFNQLTNDDEESNINNIGSIFHDSNPDIHLTTPELIERYGFPAEIHTVTTEDGYILTLHRIPHGRYNKDSNQSRPVVFLQHGMFGTSADWVLNSQNKSLAYVLAEAGYDVWMGNCRGNFYSRKHVSIHTYRIKFWRFSWHEMGVYDLPAELDYVLNTTNETQLSYIGHSMGTTMFFVLLSTKPEYNNKINFMGALGPAVFLKHAGGPAKYLAKHYGHTEKTILDIIGHGIFLPNFLTKAFHLLDPELCTDTLKIDKLCEEAIFLVCGHDPAQTNYTQLPVILSHEPSTVSTQTGFHYFQNIHSGEFSMYDHGSKKKNNLIYGFNSPPNYDLSQVKVPIALFWGPNDIICTPEDVERLNRTLPNVVLNHRVNFDEFNHIDFIFAKDADILVNKPLMEELAVHSPV